MIGTLEKTVVDCPDPGAVAAFYCQVQGMAVTQDSPDWVANVLQPRPDQEAATGSWPGLLGGLLARRTPPPTAGGASTSLIP